MKILVAVDDNPYSTYAVGEVSRLAANTWPDITLLAVEGRNGAAVREDNGPQEEHHPRIRTLRNFRADILAAIGGDLYGPAPQGGEFTPAGKGLLEEVVSGRKELRLRLGAGAPAKAILAEARESDSDLVILGCGQGGCSWGGEAGVPGKVAEAAGCPVLVVKEAKRPAKVTCCLDHARVTQESLEMINQLVTLYGVDLEVAGILKRGELKEDLDKTMAFVLDYYLSRDVRALVKVVEAEALESFISKGSQTDLMALWLGPRSTFQRLFPSHRVGELVNSALSSMLILR